MAAKSTSASTTAREEPNFIQSWFESWMTPCCKATTADMDILVDPIDLPKPAATPGKAKDPDNNVDLPCPVAKKAGVIAKYKVDNSSIGVTKRPGVAYRSSKSQAEKLKTSAKWGEIVEGVDEGDGWLRVGEHYLPMTHNGKVVVMLLKEGEIFSPKAGIPPSPARAVNKASSPVAQKVEDKVVEEAAEDIKMTEEAPAKEDQTEAEHFQGNKTSDKPLAETDTLREEGVKEEPFAVEQASGNQVQECKTCDEPLAETEARKEDVVKEESVVERTPEEQVQDCGASREPSEEAEAPKEEDVKETLPSVSQNPDMAVAANTVDETQNRDETQEVAVAEAVGEDKFEKCMAEASEDQKHFSEEVKETVSAEEPAPFVQEPVATPEEEEENIIESLCKVPSPVKICQEVCFQEEAANTESAIEFAPAVVKAVARPFPDPSAIKSPLEKLFVESILKQRAENAEAVADLKA